MRRLINMTGFISLAALVGGPILLAPPAAVAGGAAEAELHHVDPGSGRISSRPIGYLRFTEGKGDKAVDILIQIRNLPNVQSEQPLTTTGGKAVYEHGLRIRATRSSTIRNACILEPSGSGELSVAPSGVCLSSLLHQWCRVPDANWMRRGMLPHSTSGSKGF